MTARNLEKIFDPQNIAVIGASNTKNSVGYIIFNNLISSGYKGIVFPVNPKYKSVQGVRAFSSVSDLPENVDLAVIATPAETVPDLVQECGKTSTKGIIIISAGFAEMGEKGEELMQKIEELRKQYDQRILGPNCLGVIRPACNINASFAKNTVQPGNIAFISQSGALGTAALDWALDQNVGFSSFVSVGNMSDVSFGDLIDYFGTDSYTQNIILYIESIKRAGSFMSAARGFAISKPIIVVKSGRAAQGAKAATSHTGALAGEDDVYQAAFDRVGIVRVDEISDLFDCAEVLAAQPMLKGNRLTIITNAGGPGVMATDSLTKAGGKLAELSKQTKLKLDEVLPTWWSGSNPIDILGDARADRYSQALDICLSSKDSNAVLVILTPQAMTQPEKTAEAVIEKQKRYNKPVLTSWMGAGLVEKARDILQSARIPCYETPEMATYAFMNMFRYKRNIELLYQTPEHLVEEHEISVEDIHERLRRIYESGRMLLSERESKEILEDYNIETTMPRLAEDDSQAVKIAEDTGFPVVMKIESEDITHKSDAGCVALNVKDKDEVKRKFNEIVQNAQRHKADVRVDGVTVQKMISTPFHELIIGAKKYPLFGSVILFGSGGITVELIKDKVIGFPPLNQTLAQRLMEKTKIYKLISEGWRNISPADLQVVQGTLVRFAQIMVDLPEIREVDINPLMAAYKECLALDARIILDEDYFHGRIKPGRHLALSPYPTEYVKHFKFRDVDMTFRPIRPEDEPLWVDMFRSFSQETNRQRFFHTIKEMSHSERIRYTFTDFNREIAIVPEIEENGEKKLLGVARMTAQLDQETAEFAIALRDKWQSIGLGEKLFDFIMDIARQKRWKVMVADVLPDNTKMINLFKKKNCCLDYNSRDDLYNVVYRLS